MGRTLTEGDRRIIRRIARRVTSLEVGCLALASPALLFPNRYTLPALLLLLLPWPARWLAHGQPTLRTPLDWPLLGLVTMLPLSVWASTDFARSQPKLLGIILGVAAFYCVVNTTRRERDVGMWALALTVVGVGISALALISMESSYKLHWFFPFYAHFPRLLMDIPGTLTGRLGANEVGGTLALFLPFTLSLALTENRGSTSAVRWGARLWLGMSALIVAFTLLLTRSRSGIVGAVAGLLVLLMLKTRWALILPPLLGSLAWRIIRSQGVTWLLSWLLAMPALRGFQGRVEVWLRGLYVIRNAPLTGVGLNTFTRVSHARFPYFYLPSDFLVTHAHNNLIQVGVDLGLPGLICYLALLGLFGWMAWAIYHEGEGLLRAVAAGSLSGILAHQVYGLTDAITLGAKPGVFLWIVMGLICGVYVNLYWRSNVNRET